MSETKHAPGPWIAFTDVVNNHTNLVSVNERTRLVLSLPGRDKSDPDVLLATAAPELLESLEEAVELFGEIGGEWTETAKSALARAKGKQI